MANDSNEYETSLLTKCYAYGTLPPEVDDEGNIEYKVCLCMVVLQYILIFINSMQLKLINPSLERLEHLITQMKWR